MNGCSIQLLYYYVLETKKAVSLPGSKSETTMFAFQSTDRAIPVVKLQALQLLA